MSEQIIVPSAEVTQISAELIRAVNISLSLNASSQERRDAYEACEQFKETSPLCAQCGLYLARLPHTAIIRHFGLQLMEHCIKYRWNKMTQQEKVFIKEQSMALIATGTLPLLSEQNHIKDALSRLVVEMIKREWPQHWPGLLDELNVLCQRGETQTELVLMVLLRLAEDVAVLQTLESNQRRKDIYQALSAKMDALFKFFLWLIDKHCTKMHELHTVNTPEAREEANIHSRICQAVLATLSGYLDWVNTSHLVSDNGRLLHVLCLLLKYETCEKVQLAAAECLLQVVNRKGTTEERRPLLILFMPGAMNCIFEAVEKAYIQPPNESRYLFLKRLTQVVTGLGFQLHYLLGRDEATIIPSSFSSFLNALIHFTRHPSLQITQYANQLWAAFFKHEIISKNAEFLKFANLWVTFSVPKAMKVVPSTVDTPTSLFLSMDFDGGEEVTAFFHRYRADLQEALHQVTLIAPLETFSYIENCLIARLNKPVLEVCTPQCGDALEWEALNVVVEAVLSRILLCRERPSFESGVRLLNMCLAYETNDPMISSFLLSSISALFVFLSMDPTGTTLIPLVLRKIFAALIFTLPGQGKDTRSRAVKNVRLHAASLMVKLAQKYPLLLLPLFDDICATVKKIGSDPNAITQLEKVTLYEALILVSNHFCDYDRQTIFIAEVMQPCTEMWLSMKDAFSSTENFMRFVGLDKPPVEPSSQDINGQNRSQIMFCVKLLFAVIRRSACPDDPDRLSKGGFIAGYTPSGNPIHRNPAAPHLLPLLPQLMTLCYTLNALWNPEALANLSDGYKKAHDMLETYRNNALGLVNGSSLIETLLEVQRAQTPLERMQFFLSLVHEHCYLILGAAGPSLGHALYTLPGLSVEIVTKALANINHTADYRLRSIIRVFLKAFVSACPSTHENVIMPILIELCPYMFHRLNDKWQYIGQLYENGTMDNSENNTDAQCCEAVVEDNLNRLLTREYLDLLRAVMFGGSASTGLQDSDSMEVGDTPGPCGRPAAMEVLSELGVLALHNETTNQAISLCILRALSWPDNSVAMKSSQLTLPIVRLMANEGNMSELGAIHIMCSVLHGIETQGDQEGNPFNLVFLGASLYDLLRPRFPALKDILLRIPNCDPQDVEKVDEKVMSPKTSKRDKAVRDAFRKLTLRLIGPEVSKMFRKEVSIKNLPPLVKGKSKKQSSTPAANDTSDMGLSTLFQQASNNKNEIR